MNTLQLSWVTVGSHPDEVSYFEFAKTFHECQFEMTDDKFVVLKKGRVFFSTDIDLYEYDHVYQTHCGKYGDGKRFRIIQANNELKPLAILKGVDTLTIGSMFSDGYAVRFKIEEASTSHISDVHQALLNGSNNPPEGQITFHSNTHQRYENDVPVRGEQVGCSRDVVIEKNISGGIGYSVTVNNPDAIRGSWGATPMGTKPMKIVSFSDGKVELQGYGYDRFAVSMGVPISDATFEHYGMTVYHNGLNITHCVIHMLERNVDIDYYIK